MFFEGVRTSTLVVVFAFGLAGLLPEIRWRAALALLAWLLGFEAAW